MSRLSFWRCQRLPSQVVWPTSSTILWKLEGFLVEWYARVSLHFSQKMTKPILGITSPSRSYLYYQIYQNELYTPKWWSIAHLTNNLITDAQSSFHKDHSTQASLLRSIENMCGLISSGNLVGKIALDLKKKHSIQLTIGSCWKNSITMAYVVQPTPGSMTISQTRTNKLW